MLYYAPFLWPRVSRPFSSTRPAGREPILPDTSNPMHTQGRAMPGAHPHHAAHSHAPHPHPVHSSHSHAGHAPAAPAPAAAPQPAAAAEAGDETPAARNVFDRLLPQIQRAVAEEGYVTPTPIQEQAIPLLLAGRDVLGCAQTGTGKTAAFVLPLLQHLALHRHPPASGKPRALILAPTRELAAQIGDSIRAYGRHARATYTVIFGGVGQQPQVYALRNGVQIVVATPGRLLDLVGQGFVRLDAVEYFVLDEADRMLDMGFLPDMRRVIAALPPKRQSLFFSATLTREALELARTLVHNPAHVTIAPEQPAVERIVQKVMFVDKTDKDALLVKLLRAPAMDKVIVFTQRKHIANRVAEKLQNAGIPAAAIHGNKSQGARTAALNGFRGGRIRALVATDIAARGIDVDGITHVVNYELPNEPETYVHRIGRTARAGAGGDAVSFCSAEERDYLRDIERLLRRSLDVDLQHGFHSDVARHATGAAARPPPRQAHGRHGGGHGPSHPRGAGFRGTRSFGRR
jgi:ATP-dependent RNA helicase RhlE